VRIELAGYRTVVTNVDVKAGVEYPLKLTLELVGFPGVPRGSRGFPGVSRGSQGFPGVPRK
jgi:hypothetical protein